MHIHVLFIFMRLLLNKTTVVEERIMKQYLIPALLGVALLGLGACSSNNTTPLLTGAVRVANGMTDSNGLDTAIGSVATSSGVGFDSASGLTDVPIGSYNSQLTSNSVQFSVDNVSIDHDNVTTIFAYGAIDSGTEGGF